MGVIPTSEPSAEQLELVPAYASFTRRFQGVALDAVVVLTGVVVIAVISDMTRDVPGSGRVAVAALLGLDLPVRAGHGRALRRHARAPRGEPARGQ